MPYPRSRVTAVLLGLALASSVSACSTSEGRAADYGWAPTPTMTELDETTWVAPSIEDPEYDIVPGSKITLHFMKDAIAVRAGCNNMRGNASIEGTDLVVSALAATMMACEPDLMKQDVWIDTFLAKEPRIERQDDDLWLSKDDTVIHFTAEAD